MKDHLISTARLRERREQVREKVQEQRRLRADSDPFFKVADWLLSEWELMSVEIVTSSTFSTAFRSLLVHRYVLASEPKEGEK